MRLLPLLAAVAAFPVLAQAQPARSQPAQDGRPLPQPGPQELGLPNPRLPPGDPLRGIGHVVVIFEENRSFDNMFGLFPGANGIASAGDRAPQTGADGKPYTVLPPVMNTNMRPAAVDMRFPAELPNVPFQIDRYLPPTVATGDLVHRFYQEQAQINGGRMDRFAALSDAGALVMGHYDLSKTNSWRLAKEYALGDNMFHSAFGGSFLNHSFLACAQAFRWPNAPERIVAQVDADGRMVRDGQVTPDGFVVNTSRSVYLHAPSDTDPALLVPPQTMPHIGDRLDAAGVDWRWYSGGYANITDGDEHLGDLVSKLQASPQYADMLIIITYDEHGDFWDHVAPPVRDRWGPGIRVPLIAVGPTVRRGLVDHTQYDFGSILRTIEDRWNLDPLGLLEGRGTNFRNLLR